MRYLPTDPFLLEADSPHLRVGSKEMTPGKIGYIYRRVAEIRQTSVRGLAAQVCYPPRAPTPESPTTLSRVGVQE